MLNERLAEKIIFLDERARDMIFQIWVLQNAISYYFPKAQSSPIAQGLGWFIMAKVCGAITWLFLWTFVCLLEYYFAFPPTGPERLVHFLPHCFPFCLIPLLSWRLQFVILYFRWEWFKHGFYVLMKDIYGSNTKVIEIRNKNPVLNLFPQT